MECLYVRPLISKYRVRARKSAKNPASVASIERVRERVSLHFRFVIDFLATAMTGGSAEANESVGAVVAAIAVRERVAATTIDVDDGVVVVVTVVGRKKSLVTPMIGVTMRGRKGIESVLALIIINIIIIRQRGGDAVGGRCSSLSIDQMGGVVGGRLKTHALDESVRGMMALRRPWFKTQIQRNRVITHTFIRQC